MESCNCETREKVGLDVTYSFKAGHIVVAGIPHLRCVKCGETIVAPADVRRAERLVARALADEQIIAGDTFRFMHKVVGLTSKDTAELLGVTPLTVSRWERDETPIDRAAWLLVAELVQKGPAELATTLERLRSPARAKPLHLKLSAA